MFDIWMIDFPLPAVEETCYYNSTSDLVIHNITWYLKAPQAGSDISNRLWWYISGGCNYSNGTAVQTVIINWVVLNVYVTYLQLNTNICDWI